MSPAVARVSASFRDPSGFLFRYEGIVYRQVAAGYRDSYDRMMESGFWRSAVEAGLLLGHEEVDPQSLPIEGEPYKVLRPEQIPFIAYPYEWSFGQLKDAALLTLSLQKRALEFGLWLKDASAYNVQFHAGAPIFIDSLSFEPYPEGQPWVAYQQFCKHFLAPLALMAYRHVDLNKLMRVHIDGVPLEVASCLLPFRTRLSFSLMIHLHAHARALRAHAERGEQAPKTQGRGVSRTGMLGLIDSLESAVRRLSWQPQGTEWGDYYDATNYSEAAAEHKRSVIAEYLDDARPAEVWDLGANTGVFSRIASERGIRTVAFDVDPAAVEKNYRRCREQQETHILPLVMDLTNPSPDLGWNFEERMSLRSRGPADLVMALALIHHLAISNNVPLDQVAGFFHGLCRSLIVEFVPKSDSQVRRLLATREDIFPDYTQEGFERAFAGCFELKKRTPLRETERTLYLFARR